MFEGIPRKPMLLSSLQQVDTKITGTVVLNDATGNETAFTLNYTTNKATSGNDTGVLINMTDTASPGTSMFMDMKMGGTSYYSFRNDGVSFCLNDFKALRHTVSESINSQALARIGRNTTYGYLNLNADTVITINLDANAANNSYLNAGNVAIGATTANANAILDVQSTTKAFMPPRMTTTQRDAIATPTAGMVIYNSTTNVLNFYNGTAWGAV